MRHTIATQNDRLDQIIYQYYGFMNKILLIFHLFLAYIGVLILSSAIALIISITPAVIAVYYIFISMVAVGFSVVTARFLREIQLLQQTPLI